MRSNGMFARLAVSGHRRPAFVAFAADPRFDLLHLRYNAAHPGAEEDVFPHVAGAGRPGIVVYTATRWGSLLKARRMPPGEAPLRGRDAYRFVLSNPTVDLCMCGPRDDAELDEALAALDEGPLAPAEEQRIRTIGRWVHDHSLLR
jgi:aryl-alcohol dehydrogenase-like predicted oxidoreductase